MKELNKGYNFFDRYFIIYVIVKILKNISTDIMLMYSPPTHSIEFEL